MIIYLQENAMMEELFYCVTHESKNRIHKLSISIIRDRLYAMRLHNFK